jgi:hypothetical protein
MAFFCHPEPENAFTCKSSFTPYVPPQEQISLQDHIPQSVKEEKKKDNGIEYLPGERLLIKLGKQQKKKLRSKIRQTSKAHLNVDRISKSLSRVLKLV